MKQIELDKPCFSHDAGDVNSKDLVKRTISDKTLKGQSSWNCTKCQTQWISMRVGKYDV